MKKKIKIYKSLIFVITRNKYEYKLINVLNYLLKTYYDTFLKEIDSDMLNFIRGPLEFEIQIILDTLSIMELVESLKLVEEEEIKSDKFDDILVYKSFKYGVGRSAHYGLI